MRHASARVIWQSLFVLICGIVPSACSHEVPEHAPRLTLVLVADHLPHHLLLKYQSHFSGGLRRLMNRGLRFEETYLSHALTDSAPGHASLATGVPPAVHGIVSNRWVDSLTGKETHAFGQRGQNQKHGGAIEVDSVGDWLMYTDHRSKVVSVAGRPLSSVLLAGKKGHAYWYSAAQGEFVSSARYHRLSKEILKSVREATNVQQLRGTVWQPLQVSVEAVKAPLESEAEAANSSRSSEDFFHTFGDAGLTVAESFYNEIKQTPFIDALTLEAALTLVQRARLGQDHHPDLLFCGLTGLGTVAEKYGEHSLEYVDALMRLDQVLGTALEELEDTIAPGQLQVVLTADHGAMPLPAKSAQLASQQTARASACIQRAVLHAEGSLGERELFWPTGQVNTRTLRKTGISKAETLEVYQKALHGCEGVARVWTGLELLKEETRSERYGPLYQNSYFPGRSPDLFLQPDKFVSLSGQNAAPHDGPYEYNRHIPLIWYGKGVTPGQSYHRLAAVDIPVTIAATLGAYLPEYTAGVDVSPLFEGQVGASPVSPSVREADTARAVAPKGVR